MNDFSNKKILIFSDTHLTCKFNKKWFEEIAPIIERADIVIINGDFWENIGCSFKKFKKSKWEKFLFPILKNKAIFIYGNHDPERLMDTEGVNMFSKENHKDFEFKSGSKKFIVEHGDRIVPDFDSDHRIVPDFDSDHRIITTFVSRWIPSFWIYLTKLEDKDSFFGRRFKKYMDRERVEETKECRRVSLNNFEKNSIRIFGHIHTPKHNLEDNFIILGSFKNGNKRYIEIENGKINFVDEKYKW